MAGTQLPDDSPEQLSGAAALVLQQNCHRLSSCEREVNYTPVALLAHDLILVDNTALEVQDQYVGISPVYICSQETWSVTTDQWSLRTLFEHHHLVHIGAGCH